MATSCLLCLVLLLLAKVKGEIKLKIVSHGTCEGSWRRKLAFSADTALELQPSREDGRSCYRLRGTIKAYRHIHNDLRYFVMIRPSAKNKPFDCKGFDKETNCGGYGSCLYCSTCEALASMGKGAKKKKKASRRRQVVELYKDGRSFDCNSALKKGLHRNMALEFCLPNERDFANLFSVNVDVFRELMAEPKSVFVTIYAFDNGRALKRLGFYRNLAKINKSHLNIFYKLVRRQARSRYIACHNIIGSISVD